MIILDHRPPKHGSPGTVLDGSHSYMVAVSDREGFLCVRAMPAAQLVRLAHWAKTDLNYYQGDLEAAPATVRASQGGSGVCWNYLHRAPWKQYVCPLEEVYTKHYVELSSDTHIYTIAWHSEARRHVAKRLHHKRRHDHKWQL